MSRSVYGKTGLRRVRGPRADARVYASARVTWRAAPKGEADAESVAKAREAFTQKKRRASP